MKQSKNPAIQHINHVIKLVKSDIECFIDEYTTASHDKLVYAEIILSRLQKLKRTLINTKFYRVDGYSSWFVVCCENKRQARSEGVLEFGRGQVKSVARASQADIDYYKAQKAKTVLIKSPYNATYIKKGI